MALGGAAFAPHGSAGSHTVNRILLVSTSLDYGGAETQVAALATVLVQRGWSVDVVSLLAPLAFSDQFAAQGIGLQSLDMVRGIPDPRAAFRLAQIYREVEPTVVHSHMVHANLLARAARLITPVSYLLGTAHNINEGGRSLELAYRASDRFSELTTNVSKAGLERFNRVGATRPGKSLFIPNGVNLATFSRLRQQPLEVRSQLGLNNEFVWLAVGRFREQKDYPNMLRAFASGERESILLMVGDGERQQASEELAASLNISDRVRFLGLRTDIPALMSAADAFVLSSAWEGLPLVLLEAAASGLPIVSTDVGGTADIVSADTGILVPPCDHLALSSAMTQLERASTEELTQLGSKARQHVQTRFDINRVVDAWELIYEHGLTLSPGARRRAFDLKLERLQQKLVSAGLA